MLFFSAAMKLKGGPDLATGFEHLGWPAALAMPLGVLELSITILYLIPRTAVLGSILVTGYLGGAVAAHLRINEAWFIQFLLGVMLWGGLYFRDANPHLQGNEMILTTSERGSCSAIFPSSGQ